MSTTAMSTFTPNMNDTVMSVLDRGDVRAIDRLCCDSMIHRLDPEIERAFVGAIRIMCPTPIDPGVMNEMLYWYPDYTRAEIEAAMRRTLDSYRASYTHDAVLEQGMGYDVRTALYDGWSSWADTDARASVSAALCKLRNECIV